MIPLRFGSDEQFATVRRLLVEAGFTEPEVNRRFGFQKISELEKDDSKTQVDDHDDSPVALLVKLFLEGRYVENARVRDQWGDSACEALEELGLISRDPRSPDKIAATVGLYQTAGVYIVSDRWNTPDRTPWLLGSDVVYSALVSNTQRFLANMPGEPCQDFLDMCAGTGVAALSAAKHFAARAYAFDITERSTVYAEFNRRLNGATNVSVERGDLYEPAGDRTFDRIVAHPPYVPVLRPKFVFADGGEDGEAIIRGVIRDLPRYLRPGGLFYMQSMLTDRKGAPAEFRVREWLGDQGGEFDVALIQSRNNSPEEFAVTEASKSSTPADDLKLYKAMIDRLEIENFAYGLTFIQRRATPRSVFTIRRQSGPSTGRDDVRKMIAWETLLASPEGLCRVLDSAPKPNAAAELIVTHGFEEEGWEPSQYLLRTVQPFSMEAATDAWAPYLIAVCDGRKTLRTLFGELQQQEVLPAGADPLEFAQAVSVLVSGGFLFIDV